MNMKQGLKYSLNLGALIASIYAMIQRKKAKTGFPQQPQKAKSSQLSTIKIPEFVPMLYVDRELTSQFFDKIQIGGIDANVVAAEQLNIRIPRIKKLIEAYIVCPIPEIANELRIDFGTDDIDKILKKLKNEEVRLKMLVAQVEKKTSVRIDREWFVSMCKSFSDMHKYRVKMEDLYVTEFCDYYHELNRFIKAQTTKA